MQAISKVSSDITKQIQEKNFLRELIDDARQDILNEQRMDLSALNRNYRPLHLGQKLSWKQYIFEDDILCWPFVSWNSHTGIGKYAFHCRNIKKQSSTILVGECESSSTLEALFLGFAQISDIFEKKQTVHFLYSSGMGGKVFPSSAERALPVLISKFDLSCNVNNKIHLVIHSDTNIHKSIGISFLKRVARGELKIDYIKYCEQCGHPIIDNQCACVSQLFMLPDSCPQIINCTREQYSKNDKQGYNKFISELAPNKKVNYEFTTNSLLHRRQTFFAKHCNQNIFMKSYILNTQMRCAYCNKLITDQEKFLLHHIDYNHVCFTNYFLKRNSPDCESCYLNSIASFRACAARLKLMHTGCHFKLHVETGEISFNKKKNIE